jgi:hypothetical protein
MIDEDWKPLASHAAMIGQLRSLLQLTQTEVQIARIRVSQARTDAVRKELQENADNAERRTAEITAELQRLGGVADVVSPLVGRLTAIVKGTFEQAEPVEEALLGDLMLEHQLGDRATYLRALAEAAHDKSVSALAERLTTAHRATVEWLTTVLAEEALGGPPALRATPTQAVAGGVARVVNYPVRFARDQVNRTLGRFQARGEQVREGVNQAAGKAAQFSENARDVLATGRNASLERAEKVARTQGDTDAAHAAHEARERLGTLHASELPIADYEQLSATAAADAVKQLDRVDDLNKIIHYEEANRNRHSVVSAAQTRHAALAQEIAGIR